MLSVDIFCRLCTSWTSVQMCKQVMQGTVHLPWSTSMWRFLNIPTVKLGKIVQRFYPPTLSVQRSLLTNFPPNCDFIEAVLHTWLGAVSNKTSLNWFAIVVCEWVCRCISVIMLLLSGNFCVYWQRIFRCHHTCLSHWIPDRGTPSWPVASQWGISHLLWSSMVVMS